MCPCGPWWKKCYTSQALSTSYQYLSSKGLQQQSSLIICVMWHINGLFYFLYWAVLRLYILFSATALHTPCVPRMCLVRYVICLHMKEKVIFCILGWTATQVANTTKWPFRCMTWHIWCILLLSGQSLFPQVFPFQHHIVYTCTSFYAGLRACLSCYGIFYLIDL